MCYSSKIAEQPTHDAQEGEVITVRKLPNGGTAMYGRNNEVACIRKNGCRLETLAAAATSHPAVNRLLPGETVSFRKRRAETPWWQQKPAKFELFNTIGRTLLIAAAVCQLPPPPFFIVGLLLLIPSTVLLHKGSRDWFELPDGSIVGLEALVGFKFQLLPAVATPPPVETIPQRIAEEAAA